MVKYIGKMIHVICMQIISINWKLYELFNDTLSNFAHYGVTKDEWQPIIKCTHDKGGNVEKLILELVPWADENYDVFTIMGI